MAELASPEEARRAFKILFELQSADPNRLRGVLNKYANPFTTFPLLKEPTRSFLKVFEASAPVQQAQAEAETLQPNTVDEAKIKELIEEFDREYAAAKERRVTAQTASKKFAEDFKSKAKDASAQMSEAAVPTQEQTNQPLTEERVGEIAVATLFEPVLPEHKKLFFHALETFASEQPDRRIEDLVPRATGVVEAAAVLTAPPGTLPTQTPMTAMTQQTFGQLAVIVNQIDRIPKNVMSEMTNRWGEAFTSSEWFNKFRADANKMLADQASAARIMGKLASVLTDVKTAVFQGPLEENIFTVIETYRLLGTQGIQVANFSGYRNVALGYGRQLARTGANYALRAGMRAEAQKLAGTAAGGILKTALGIGTGGWGFVASLGASLLGRVGNALKNFVGLGEGKDPLTPWLILGCVVLGIFMFILPSFGQEMINTSLADTLTGGGAAGGTSVSCQLTPDNPLCTFTPCTGDCRWPTSGYITQGPRSGQFCSSSANPTHGTGSDSSQNALDIAAFGNAPVYATRVGTVLRVFSGCPESGASFNRRCGGGPDPTHPGDGNHPEYAGYGNHVVLRTDNGYTIIFGHLKSAIGVTYGQQITNPNTQIGWMDNSGNSYGSHLHFGVLSGGSVLNLIPTNDPAFSQSSLEGCIQKTNGCTKVCPVKPVKAGV